LRQQYKIKKTPNYKRVLMQIHAVHKDCNWETDRLT